MRLFSWCKQKNWKRTKMGILLLSCDTVLSDVCGPCGYTTWSRSACHLWPAGHAWGRTRHWLTIFGKEDRRKLIGSYLFFKSKFSSKETRCLFPCMIQLNFICHKSQSKLKIKHGPKFLQDTNVPQPCPRAYWAWELLSILCHASWLNYCRTSSCEPHWTPPPYKTSWRRQARSS